LVRIFKLGRCSTATQLTARVIASRGPASITIIPIRLVLILLSASLMYHAERDPQPDAFSSIPAAMWWAVATLSTVGYGDVYPITPVGKLLPSVIARRGSECSRWPPGLSGPRGTSAGRTCAAKMPALRMGTKPATRFEFQPFPMVTRIVTKSTCDCTLDRAKKPTQQRPRC